MMYYDGAGLKMLNFKIQKSSFTAVYSLIYVKCIKEGFFITFGLANEHRLAITAIMQLNYSK